MTNQKNSIKSSIKKSEKIANQQRIYKATNIQTQTQNK